jgi:hypothetical protein
MKSEKCEDMNEVIGYEYLVCLIPDVSSQAQEAPNSESGPGEGGGAEVSPQSSAVVLERVPESMSREMLTLLVETLSGLEEDNFSLEVISETNRAVVTFNNPKGWSLFQIIDFFSSKNTNNEFHF